MKKFKYRASNKNMKSKLNEKCKKIKEEITDDNFWIVRTGYSKNCELKDIPEVKFARIINEAIMKRMKREK